MYLWAKLWLWPTRSLGIQASVYRCRVWIEVLWLKDLRVGQWIEPCIESTQENSIENSIQDYLSYIQISNGPCELFLAYPKWPCIHLKVNIYITYCMISSLSEYSIFFYVSYDLSLLLLLCCLMWLMCDQVMSSLTLTLSSKNRKIKIKIRK